ncbi:TPA: hypothetical protein MHP61_22025 [Klebsiella quasipneumoniae subsp. similipneumoniae]|nr:hypothetical protein [Klebsiella quasipneumoniae subsp. similipneumoniae]
MSLALTALYYLENKLSNFMKSCFKNYAALHIFTASAAQVTVSPLIRTTPHGAPHQATRRGRRFASAKN